MSSVGLARIGQWLCLGGATIGAIGLLGWLSGTNLLTTLVPGQPAMMPNTAVALLLIGSAAAARRPDDIGPTRKTLSLLAVLAVLAVGAGTLAQYWLGIDLHIDRLLVRGQTALYAGRPSPLTALALTCLATALLLFDVRATARVRPSEWLILCAALTAFTGFMGFILGAEQFYRLVHAPLIGLSPLTAMSLLLTSAGLLLERPTAGVMRVATSPGPGSGLLRRLSLGAIIAPMLVGLMVTRIEQLQNIVEVSIGLAILASMMTVVGLSLLLVTAVSLNRAHERLEANRAKTRSLVEQAPDGIFVADIHGRYTDVNDAGVHLLGYSREEIVGKTIFELLHPEEVERLWQSRHQLLGGAIDVAEWRLRHKDGTYVPVEVSARILPDNRWQGFVRDIRERKRLEDELRLSEARSTGILSISSDAIICIDEEQHITLFNDGAETIFGHSKTEVTGAPLDILIPERLRAVHREHVTRFAASPSVARKMLAAVIVGLRKNGEEFPADAAISKLDVDGKQILTVVLRDITEQKRIEKEQKFLAEVGPVLATTLDYEETLSRIAEIAVQGLSDFCIVDVVDDDGEVQRVRVVSGDPSKAWICDALHHPSPDQSRPRLVRSALESKRPVLVQRPSPEDIEALAQNDDQLRAVHALGLQSVMAVPLVARGKLLGAISLLSATPSRIYGREDLRVAQELAQRAALAVDNARLYRAAQRAIQDRDDVLGFVAHDLRNPLSTILMEAWLIRRHAPEPDRRFLKRVEVIVAAATRMNRLIQDLLDVTRMEAGRLTIEQSRLPAAQIAAEAVEPQKALASSASLELRLEVSQQLPDVWADHDRLLQVFENLIGNAIKFTASGGCITVGASPRGDDVLFWVRDTGPGIAVEDQPHLFDRFWQASKAGRGGGAGLGLPIVKGIVEAHGGRIWVDSAPGRGSTFFFTIPSTRRIERTTGDRGLAHFRDVA